MTRALISNRIKSGEPNSGDTVEDIKRRLAWLAMNPGEWLHWGRSFSAARDLRHPAFERKLISPSRSDFDHLPDSNLAPGLWIRYRGVQ